MTAKTTTKYVKTQPPEDEASRVYYLEQQLRAIQVALNQAVDAINQIQAISTVAPYL